MNGPYLNDIRECLYHGPSLATWTELNGLLAQAELFDPRHLEGIVQYADEHLNRWPDAMRRMTREQVKRAKAKSESPRPVTDTIARYASLKLGSRKFHPKKFNHFEALTGLSLSSEYPGTLVDAVTHFSGRGNLRGLEIDFRTMDRVEARDAGEFLGTNNFGGNLGGLSIRANTGSKDKNIWLLRNLAQNSNLAGVERFSVTLEGMDDWISSSSVITPLVESDLRKGLTSFHCFGDLEQTHGISPENALVDSGILVGMPDLGLRLTQPNVLEYLATECPDLRHLTIRNGEKPFKNWVSSKLEVNIESLDFSATYGSKDDLTTRVWPNTRRSFLNCFRGLKRLRLIASEGFYIETILENNPGLEDLEMSVHYGNLDKLLKCAKSGAGSKIRRLSLVGCYDGHRHQIHESPIFNNLEVLELHWLNIDFGYRFLRKIVIAAIQRGEKMTIVCHGKVREEHFYRIANEFKDALGRSSVRLVYIPKNMY